MTLAVYRTLAGAYFIAPAGLHAQDAVRARLSGFYANQVIALGHLIEMTHDMERTTPEEAHDYIGTMTDDDATWNAACREIGESGGTIGPLPDGTIIDVRHVDWIAMRAMAGRLPVRTHPKPDVLAAFNADASAS
jgi:hypothetical protein